MYQKIDWLAKVEKIKTLEANQHFCTHLKYSKSLSWAENVNFQPSTANNLFKFSAQDSELKYLGDSHQTFWQKATFNINLIEFALLLSQWKYMFFYDHTGGISHASIFLTFLPWNVIMSQRNMWLCKKWCWNDIRDHPFRKFAYFRQGRGVLIGNLFGVGVSGLQTSAILLSFFQFI